MSPSRHIDRHGMRPAPPVFNENREGTLFTGFSEEPPIMEGDSDKGPASEVPGSLTDTDRRSLEQQGKHNVTRYSKSEYEIDEYSSGTHLIFRDILNGSEREVKRDSILGIIETDDSFYLPRAGNVVFLEEGSESRLGLYLPRKTYTQPNLLQNLGKLFSARERLERSVASRDEAATQTLRHQEAAIVKQLKATQTGLITELAK